MKFSLSWLKEYLDTSVTLHEITDTLNRIGLEVEFVDDRQELAPFLIAKILKAEPHENANKLQKLSVDIGKENPLQIVCGAPNAREGLVSVLAQPGDYIPGLDITLSVGNIRGVKSYGMLCSKEELKLSNESEGIIELPHDAPLGTSFSQYSGLNDPIIEIAITPNRADCTSVYGVARDLAAAGLGTLKALEKTSFSIVSNKKHDFTIDPAIDHLCHDFRSRLICNVQNGSSPEWLQKKLLAIGAKPINLFVDILNYLTFDIGCPMHVFDADKIKGSAKIRSAQEGEIFHGLNDKKYQLKDNQLVISDENGILSLSGIMGSLSAACDENTKNIIIEAALWDPHNIAQTGRALALHSDARYRFERGVDPEIIEYALNRASDLILKYSKGEAQEENILKIASRKEKKIIFPLTEIKRLTSLSLPKDKVIAFLKALGCSVEDLDLSLSVISPSWRYDLHEKVDLVEEVMRLYGIDKIDPQPLSRIKLKNNILNHTQRLTHYSTRLLASRGMLQIINWSFIAKNEACLFGGSTSSLSLENPISKDMSDMRPSLLPGLLKSVHKNQVKAIHNLAIFEAGHSYKNETAKGQQLEISGLRVGHEKHNASGRFWQIPPQKVDCFDSKEDAFAVLAACGIQTNQLLIEQNAPHWYHPGQSGVIKMGPKIILGYFGTLHPSILNAFKINNSVCGFEIFLENLPFQKKKANKNKSDLILPSLQPLYRDFSFIIDKNCPVALIIKAAKNVDKKLIQDATIFDVFYDKDLGENKKSVALKITIQPIEETLTDAKLEELSNKVIQSISAATKATLRDS